MRRSNLPALTGGSRCRCTVSVPALAAPPPIRPAHGFLDTVGAAVHEPTITVHTPGVSNYLPDWLSRRHQPGSDTSIPTALTHIDIEIPMPRTQSFWLARPLPKASKRRSLVLANKIIKEHRNMVTESR